MSRARGNRPQRCPYATKGGLKLEFALRRFALSVQGLRAADFGCHRGGFTDCLLAHGAAHVYAVDTGYGVLDWRLRNDPRVTVRERSNLLHWTDPDPLDLVVIDAGWTRQSLSVPAAFRSLKADGLALSLVKPQYEAAKRNLHRGVLHEADVAGVLANVQTELSRTCVIAGEAKSPLPGSGGNTEHWLLLRRKETALDAPALSSDRPARSECSPSCDLTEGAEPCGNRP